MESRVESTDYGIGDDGSERAKTTEGPVAKAIESKTAQLPSDIFLWGALGSMGLSLILQMTGKSRRNNFGSFVGQWVPTLLVLGLYNKIVKVAGHDRARSGL